MTNALLAIIAGACLMQTNNPPRNLVRDDWGRDRAVLFLAGVVLCVVGLFMAVGFAGLDLLARFR